MRRRVVLIGAAVALLLPASHAAGSPHGPTGRWEAIRADAFDRLENVRRAVDTGTLASAVRGAAALVKVPLRSEAPTPGAPSLAVPSEIAAPVAALEAAVSKAGRLAQASLLAPAAEVQRRADRFAVALGRSGGMMGRSASQLRGMQRFEGLAERLVDRTTLYSGALLLAEAIDASLPALQAYAATLPPAPSAVGCEIADQAPALCIGGQGANTYTKEYALVIDLGGDDLHAHAAGSADPQANGLAGSVTIDVGGNDRYESTSPTPSGGAGAQGSGNVGGIGVLVDVAGNDSYAITGTDPVEQTLGQAFGVGGVGILADAAGNDRYSIVGTPPAETTAAFNERANGQSYALIGAMAITLDGAGDDQRLIETRPSPTADQNGVLHPGNPITLGYGYSALSGPSIWADGGGTDTNRIAATTLPLAADETRGLELPTGTAGGPGFGGLGGAGVALSGAGSTSWLAETRVEARETGVIFAGSAGAAALGGYGAFHDAGGADRYEGKAISIAVAHRTAGEACDCDGPNAEAVVGSSSAGVGSSGALGGVGLFHEAGGADAYVAHGIARAEAVAHDSATSGGSRTARATASVSSVRATGLGWGDLGGAAFVLDAGASDDTYSFLAESDSVARATAASPETQLVTQEAPSFAQTQALGFAILQGGYGEFRDAGGNDSYSAVSRSAPSLPEDGVIATAIMGSGVGGSSALFVDLGGTDAVTLTPSEAVCAGEPRATGRYWQDCESFAVGFNV